jgi:hypothetical protein
VNTTLAAPRAGCRDLQPVERDSRLKVNGRTPDTRSMLWQAIVGVLVLVLVAGISGWVILISDRGDEPLERDERDISAGRDIGIRHW